MQSRGCTENVVQEDGRLTGPNPLLACGRGKAVGDFRREDVGREEFVNAVAVLIPQTDRLAGVRFRKDPLERHAAVENVLHGRSRVSRMRSTAMFCSPKSLRFSSRIWSMRSQAAFILSGRRMPFTRSSRVCCNWALTSAGMPRMVSVVFIGLLLSSQFNDTPWRK